MILYSSVTSARRKLLLAHDLDQAEYPSASPQSSGIHLSVGSLGNRKMESEGLLDGTTFEVVSAVNARIQFPIAIFGGVVRVVVPSARLHPSHWKSLIALAV
ncbi:hypothetical protein Tcan_16486 [Toxocara canis]|uniref:Uncharacterized protein n=1 Tax=Toxocara canis TaxID=6265 RepID=A0A0B2W3F2_TOXCA|nr:hypothetical protein Tcan_16486 [Toxocara canis]